LVLRRRVGDSKLQFDRVIVTQWQVVMGLKYYRYVATSEEEGGPTHVGGPERLAPTVLEWSPGGEALRRRPHSKHVQGSPPPPNASGLVQHCQRTLLLAGHLMSKLPARWRWREMGKRESSGDR
jgi:hypothetical protein